MKGAVSLALALSFVAAPRLATAQAADRERGAAALGELIRGLGVTARVLVIGAHPDDEDTQLITWLARGRGVETAYLSLTRGDGGQNLIGNELGEALGVIRTEELLAARRIDGGRQYFTRAYDFGFSKSAEETYRHWPKDSVLRDVVTVVRAFRPHVIVSVFSGTPRDGHGHHQVAGLLAREAYDVAGDTVRMPTSINSWRLPGWTPLKFYRSSRSAPDSATLRVNVGEYDVLHGRSYAEIAGESRSQHKSQGFGSLQRKGVIWDYLRREATRVNAQQDAKAEQSIFDGIETTLSGLAYRAGNARDREAIAALDSAVAAVQHASYWTDPSPIVPLLAKVSWRGQAPVSAEVRETFDQVVARATRAIELASSATADVEVDRELVGVGAAGRDSIRARVTVYNRGRAALVVRPPVVRGRCAADASPGEGGRGGSVPGNGDGTLTVAPDSARVWHVWLCSGPSGEPLWLRSGRVGDMFATTAGTVADEDEEDDVRIILSVPTDSLARRVIGVPLARTPIRRFADPVRGEVRRPVAFVPRISILLDRPVELARARVDIDRTIRVHLRSAAVTTRLVTVTLRPPPGLRPDSASRAVTLSPHGSATVSFRLRGRLGPGEQRVIAYAESAGERYEIGYSTIDYEHIRPRRLYRRASTEIVVADIAVPPGLNVAYLRGVGDNVAPAIEQLGIPVRIIGATELASLDPSRTGVLVIGPRAYESNDTLVANAAAVLDFARRGGTVVVQYGQHEMTQPGVMPYPIALERRADRVTEEDAPVRILDPGSPVLTYPNRITDRDFAGWVQERSLYMPRTFDPRYRAPLSMNDPGEPPNQGAILVTPVGRGTYVYTTLSFFRQLPAGHPGAARLFVNLLAVGQRPANR
jgi:LmbE family N-acetylglucosaminyl deacetylase